MSFFNLKESGYLEPGLFLVTGRIKKSGHVQPATFAETFSEALSQSL